MDLSDSSFLALFLEIYGSLPRAGPGGNEHTVRALKMVPGELPSTVLDLGCGPGAQTLALARALPDATMLAIDILPPMVEEARRRSTDSGFDHRVRVEVGDMGAPPVSPASQDLIWCEGAIYFLGVTEALRTWRALLTDKGCVVFTEPIWLQPDPPPELVQWWQSEYPAITDENGIRAAISAASFETIWGFPLPAAAWWDEYYAPMERRISAFEMSHPDDPMAAEIATMAKTEIDYFRRFSDFYSYCFFVTRPTAE